MFVCFLVVSQLHLLYYYITRRTFYILMLLYWFTTGNTEVRLFVTDSTEHAFNMCNCLLKRVLNFSDIESDIVIK